MIVGLIPWPDYNIHIFDGWSSFLTGVPLGKWYFNELCVWFLVMSFVIGFYNGYDSKDYEIVHHWGRGELVGAALIVGLSRGVSAIMKETGFDMYLLNAGVNAMRGSQATCSRRFPTFSIADLLFNCVYFWTCICHRSNDGSLGKGLEFCSRSNDYNLYCGPSHCWELFQPLELLWEH